MDADALTKIAFSACPHDCPSTCALEVERLDARTIGRVRGARENSYTAGVVCAKVARYAERTHHPDRLRHPLRRTASGHERLSWEDALDEVAEAFLKAERALGAETVWPYFYAGTMGLLQRDGIERLRHAKRYSGQHSTICTTLVRAGWLAGTGALRGPDPREMALSDLIVSWGGNPASTQVNAMTHIQRARKTRGAELVVVDPYRTRTAQVADMHLAPRPGTDAALACAVMHVLFRDGHADRAFMAEHTDCPDRLEAHLRPRTPEWAAAITGLSAREIEAFAKLYGETERSYIRVGYGFSRSRNGAVAVHAVSCLPSVTGAWKREGGGAFFSNADIYGWDKTLIEGLDVRDPEVRVLDMSRIGPDPHGRPGVARRRPAGDGDARAEHQPRRCRPRIGAGEPRPRARRPFPLRPRTVHDRYAAHADIVLPATTFVEHNDIYQGGGHQHIALGPKLIEPVGEARPNHFVICELARRLGAEHPGFAMSEEEIIDATLRGSGRGSIDELRRARWIDCQPDFETSHFLDGFAMRTANSISPPTGRGWDPTTKRCRLCPTTSTTSSARTRRIPSASSRRPHTTISTVRSPRPRPRSRRKRAPASNCTRRTRASWEFPPAASCAWATGAAKSACTPKSMTGCSAASRWWRASGRTAPLSAGWESTSFSAPTPAPLMAACASTTRRCGSGRRKRPGEKAL